MTNASTFVQYHPPTLSTHLLYRTHHLRLCLYNRAPLLARNNDGSRSLYIDLHAALRRQDRHLLSGETESTLAEVKSNSANRVARLHL
jgi:hypothetical protein